MELNELEGAFLRETLDRLTHAAIARAVRSALADLGPELVCHEPQVGQGRGIQADQVGERDQASREESLPGNEPAEDHGFERSVGGIVRDLVEVGRRLHELAERVAEVVGHGSAPESSVSETSEGTGAAGAPSPAAPPYLIVEVHLDGAALAAAVSRRDRLTGRS